MTFKKVNGQAGEMMGVKLYKLEYEAEIEYLKGINAHCKDKNEYDRKCYQVRSFGGEIREKGERRAIKDKITFEKTEKGWKGPDGNIY